MPTVDGLEAARQLAATGLRRPVVVVTGVEDPASSSARSRAASAHTSPSRSTHSSCRQRSSWPPSRHAEFEALEAEVDRAQQALEDRKLVERAKGLLMSALHLSEQDAFRRLQLTARERNLRLAEVASGSSSSRASSNRRLLGSDSRAQPHFANGQEQAFHVDAARGQGRLAGPSYNGRTSTTRDRARHHQPRSTQRLS